MIKVKTIPILNDNYTYLVFNSKNGSCMCIDPSTAEPVIDEIEKNDLQLKYIANTHHHHDHVGGNLELKKKFDCKIMGNENDKKRIPGIDIYLKPEYFFSFSDFNFQVLDFPGHTLGHIGLYLKNEKMLFSGDTIFSLGCGRLFEGTPREMSQALLKIKSLPDKTKIYFGHEYTQANKKFVYHLMKKCNELDELDRLHNIKISNAEPTSPTLLEIEKKYNPFLKFDEKNYFEKIGLKYDSIEENFFKLRKMKDEF